MPDMELSGAKKIPPKLPNGKENSEYVLQFFLSAISVVTICILILETEKKTIKIDH